MRWSVALAMSACVSTAVSMTAAGQASPGGSGGLADEPARVERAQWRPVDATVADVDPRAASQRRAHMGIGMFTPVHRMRTRVDPAAPLGEPANFNPIDPQTGLNLPQPYRYEAPGVHARLQRPSYLMVTDPGRQDMLYQGEGDRRRPYVAMNRQPLLEPLYIELIPANTVFELTPETIDPADDAVPEGWVDQRLDGRVGASDHQRWTVDGQQDGRVRARRIEELDPADRYEGRPMHESIARPDRGRAVEGAASKGEAEREARSEAVVEGEVEGER